MMSSCRKTADDRCAWLAVRYKHEIIGVNSRLDALQAALLHINYSILTNGLMHGVRLLRCIIVCLQVQVLRFPLKHHLENMFIISTPFDWKNRDKVAHALIEKKVLMVFTYPIPLHLQEAYSAAGKPKGHSCDRESSREVLSLPMHTELMKNSRSTLSNQYSKRWRINLWFHEAFTCYYSDIQWADNVLKIIPEVLAQDEGFHVLVVDDNSPDGTANLVKRCRRAIHEFISLKGE